MLTLAPSILRSVTQAVSGRSLEISSIAATLRYLDVSKLEENLDVLRPYIFREI